VLIGISSSFSLMVVFRFYPFDHAGMDVQTTATLTQEQFDEFARLSGDDNPIHVDPGFSAQTRFGRTVAHGMFLFSILQAEVARTIGGAVRLSGQQLVFRAPTFADDSLTLTLTGDSHTVDQRITDSGGTVTAEGTALIGRPPPADESSPAVPSPRYKGMEVGMTASRTRVFAPSDVTDYLDLVDDPNPAYRGPEPELPPSLLGGMVSWLLGVDLPGRGTNWLKQSYRFHVPIRTPVEVTTAVTITRLRPDKGLVNLSSTCTADDLLVATGQSLVLAVDVAPR
jgi:acyl dehydratase